MTDTAVLSDAVADTSFSLAGDLTIHCAAERSVELLEKLSAHLGLDHPTVKPPQELGLDVSNLADIDSAGMQLLVAARRFCDRYGTRLTLQGPSHSVRAALQTLQLDPTLHPIKLEATHGELA